MHGRLRRTARFIATTTYADRDQANALIQRVRTIHGGSIVNLCSTTPQAVARSITGRGRIRCDVAVRRLMYIHDLRHSFASTAIMDKVPLATIGKLLGHLLPETTAKYAHLADDVIADAAQRISGGLAQAIGLKS